MTLTNADNMLDNVVALDSEPIDQISYLNTCASPLRYCRTCMVDIGDEYDGSQRFNTVYRFAIQSKELWEYDIRTMVLCLTSLKVDEDDGFSQDICSNCLQKLIYSFSFRLQCINVDSELKKHPTDTIESSSYQENLLDSSPNILDDSITEFLKVKQNEKKEYYLEQTTDKPNDAIEYSVKDECHSPIAGNTIHNDVVHTIQEPHSSNDTPLCFDTPRTGFSLETNHFVHPDTEKQVIKNCDGKRFNAIIKEEFIPRSTDKPDVRCESELQKNNMNVSHHISPNSKKKNVSSNLNISQEHKTNDSIVKCICYVCGKQFKSKEFLRKHIARHSNVKPFQCEKCNKPFYIKDDLFKHMLKHSSNNFICDLCGATFTRKDSLKTHEKIHLGIKPHTCPQCTKRFVNSYNLQNHIRTHSKEAPFVCTICRRAFKQKTSLVRHSKVHNPK